MSQEQPRIIVLLSVYNGAAWLAEQLDSILAQSHENMLIVCRDDGSTDASPAILEQYENSEPGRVKLIRDQRGNLGASAGFSRLMEIALMALDQYRESEDGQADGYVALADQDDIWHRDRLARCLERMREEEGRLVAEQPVVVHSDLRVIAETGEEIAASMARYQGLAPWREGFAAQLLSNSVTGCTALLNAALLRKALPVPSEAIMHDWWLSLVATAFGRRCYIDEALVQYRQHGANAVGARKWQKPVPGRAFIRRVFDRRNQEAFELVSRQAAAFVSRYRGQMSWRQRSLARLTGALAASPAPVQKLCFRLLRRL